MSGTWARWLGLRPGEFGKTAGMFLYLMMAVGTFVTGRIVRDTLFLSRYHISYLPYMYVWVAGVMGLLSYAYSHFADRFRRDRLVLAVTSMLLVLVVASRVILWFQADWFYPVLYVFVEVMGALLIIQFWTFANDIFDTREAKRLFGLVGAGGVVATIAAGFAVRGLAPTVGTANLLFLCAALLVGCLTVVAVLSRTLRTELTQSTSNTQGKPRAISLGADLGEVFTSRHLKVIAWIVLLTFIVVTVVDYQFKLIARVSYLNREDQLSGFFGLFYAATGVLSIFIQFLFTGRLLQRFGVIVALLLLPVFLVTGSGLFLFLPALWSVALLKGADSVLRYTVNDATTQILYLPVPGTVRGRAKAFIDGILKPAAQGITGLAIAWTAGVVAHRVHWLGLGTLAVLAGWIVLVLSLKREYLRTLVGTLRQRRMHFGRTDFAITDSNAVEALQDTLAHADEKHVLNALEMVPYVRMHDWSEALGRLLTHDSARVRLQALKLMEPDGLIANVEGLMERFDDPDQEVRAAAVVSYCTTLKEKAMGVVEPLLLDTSVRVQAAAVVGLIRYGGLDGIVAAAERLKVMLASDEPSHRKAGAWTIGQVGVRTFYRSLLPLLRDAEPAVRVEAVRAAGELKCPELTLPLIYMLGDVQARKAVVSALGAYGTQLITTLRTVLDNRREDPAIRQAIPRVLARIGDQLCMDVLSNVLETEETKLRSNALDAILVVHLRNSSLRRDHEMLRRALHRELKDAFQLKVTIAEVSGLPSRLLSESLEHQFDGCIERIFKLLRVLHPARHLEAIWLNLSSPIGSVRANSLELLDNTLDPETRRCLLPLLEVKEAAKVVEHGDELFPLLHLDAHGWLHRLLVTDHDWTIVCALHAVAELGDPEFESVVRLMLSHSSSLVRETSAYCMQRLLSPKELPTALSGLRDDPSPRVRAFLQSLALTTPE